MSDANREAIERMFTRVIAAARKVGLADDEIRLIVDVEILGEGAPKPEPEPKEARAPAQDAPARPEPGPDKLVPELDEPLPDWDEEEQRPEIRTTDGEPLTLEGLGMGKVTTPVRLKPPPKTKEEKEFVRDMLGGE